MAEKETKSNFKIKKILLGVVAALLIGVIAGNYYVWC